MGSSFDIMCTRCDYRKQLLTGIGMLHTEKHLIDPSSNVLSNIIESKKEYKHVRKLLDENKGVFRRYGFRIIVCSRCGEFQSHFYYEIRGCGQKPGHVNEQEDVHVPEQEEKESHRVAY